jgi:alpha-glucosidase
VEGWYDFNGGAYYEPEREVVIAAPLDRIPMFARAGAMIALTGHDDFSRLHDEPSRHVRVFPARKSASATFALYEDDGISLRYREGDYAEVIFEIHTTATEVALSVRVSGRYELPYRRITVEFPPGEKRRISLSGAGMDLALA